MRQVLGWVVSGILLAVGIAGLLHSNAKATAFEQRAEHAEAVATVNQVAADSAKAEVRRLQAVTVHQDTVVKYRTAQVAAVDAASPPPVPCAPNLAVRDTLIAAQRAQIDTLKRTVAVSTRALFLVQAARDTLLTTLQSRPRPTSLLGPNVGLGAFIGYCGNGAGVCAGVGVTLNLGGVHL